MRFRGAMSCWTFRLDGPVTAATGLGVVLVVLVVVDVVVDDVVVVGGASIRETGPALHTTPAASVSWQSLMPQPSNRQSVRFRSPPTQ